MVDDKVLLLAAVKAVPGNRLTTVFPRQGHYALDPVNKSLYPTPDVTVEHIGDLVDFDRSELIKPPIDQTRTTK